MAARILFLTSPYLYQQTVDTLARICPDCETSVVIYESFSRIPVIFEQLADNFDAVMVPGGSAKHTILKAFPDTKKLIVSHHVDSDALHRDLLRFAIETQNLDFSRIAMDFLIPFGVGCSVIDFLRLEDSGVFQLGGDPFSDQKQREALYSPESAILDGVVKLWEAKSIDIVYCLYSSIAPELQKRNIPFRSPFISDIQLTRLIRDVLVRVELEKLHENHPAIVQIFPRNTASISPDQIIILHQTVQKYLQAHMVDSIVQRTESSCLVITTLRVLRSLTGDFHVCHFSSMLGEMLDFPVNVAYGIGTNVSHAMNNVQIASKEAKITNQPFIVDSNGNLIGPLGSEKHMVIPADSLPNISQIARRCNLSAMTIQRLITILQQTQSDKITIQALAAHMNTTIRNANRIMLNLCRANMAKPVYTQTSHSRGRPVQVFSIHFS